jgi:phthalate 4,5-dioxygenase oxygenase subunit
MGLDDERFWDPVTCQFHANWADRLGQNRAAMKENWTGYSGIEQEDAILAISMGPIVNRTKEHLVPADSAVMRLRRRLLEAVRMVEKGEEPIGNQIPDLCHIKALVDTVIDSDDDWREEVKSNRVAVAA